MDGHNQEANDQSKLIKELLKIDKPRQTIADEIADTLKIRSALFAENAPCSGMPIEPYPERYFVAQEFNETKDDLRRALEDSFRKLGFSSDYLIHFRDVFANVNKFGDMFFCHFYTLYVCSYNPKNLRAKLRIDFVISIASFASSNVGPSPG